MRRYPHLLGRIFNTPLAIQPDKLQAIIAAIGPRLGVEVGTNASALTVQELRRDGRKPYAVTDRGVAVIPVDGTLVHVAAGAEAPSGLTTYRQIETMVMDAATDPAVRAILLDVDSPGGEVRGCLDLADLIYEARATKPIWAVADERAASSAYALASSASRVVAPRTAVVGSIGIICLHRDESERDKTEGLRYTTIFAGARKNDLNPHERLSSDARAWAEQRVARDYGLFVDTVARNRGLTAKSIRATEAAVYDGESARGAGLVDAVMPFREALAELTQSLDRRRSGSPLSAATAAPETSSAATAATVAPAVYEVEAVAAAAQVNHKETNMTEPTKGAVAEGGPAPVTASPAAAAASTAAASNVVELSTARGEGYAHAHEIVELCHLAGVPNLAAEFLQEKLTPAAARKRLTEARAKSGEEVISAIRPGAGTATKTSVAESAIVQACKHLAAQSSARNTMAKGA